MKHTRGMKGHEDKKMRHKGGNEEGTNGGQWMKRRGDEGGMRGQLMKGKGE